MAKETSQNTTYNIVDNQQNMVHEPMPQYGCQPIMMSHFHMSFGVDFPKDEDPKVLQLRVIAFAEYLSSRHNTSIRDKAIRQLNKPMLLDENWDGYGSPQIDAIAATNARNIIKSFNNSLLSNLRITPTETSSISLRLIRNSEESIGINCCKNVISYFIESKEKHPEFYSDLPYTAENKDVLIRRIEQW